MTTRRLMVAVAFVATGIAAATRIPPLLEQRERYQTSAEISAGLQQRLKDKLQTTLAHTRALQSDLDQWRRSTGSVSRSSERYLTSRVESEIADAEYYRALAKYHAMLEQKYRRAAWFPWRSLPRDPPPPRDPLVRSSMSYEPGKVYEILSNAGASVAYSPDGTAVAVGCQDRVIRLFEPRTGNALATFSLPEGMPSTIAFSPDGKTLVAGGPGSLIRQWDVATGRDGRALFARDGTPGVTDPRVYVGGLAFAPDGKTIAVATYWYQGGEAPGQTLRATYAVKRFDLDTGALLWEHLGMGGTPVSIACSPDGETLAYANGSATLLDLRTGNEKAILKPVAGYVLAVALAPDGQTLAGAGSSTSAREGFSGAGRVTLWDIRTRTIRKTLNGPTGRASAVAFSPDGRTVAAGGRGPTKEGRLSSSSVSSKQVSEVTLWDAATGHTIWTAEGETEVASSLAFSPDGQQLAFCDWDYVCLVDTASGKLVTVFMETTRSYRARDTSPATHGKAGP